MMKGKYTKRRPDQHMLLPVLVTLGVMLTSAVSADESFLSKPSFADLLDGDITLTGAEHGRAGIHMSFMSPSVLNVNRDSTYVVTGFTGSVPDVYISLRLPW